MVWLCLPLQLLLCLSSSITLYTCLLSLSPTHRFVPASGLLHLLFPLPGPLSPDVRLPPSHDSDPTPMFLFTEAFSEAASPSLSFTSLSKLASLFVYAFNATVLPLECQLHGNTPSPSSLFSLLGCLQHPELCPENGRYSVNTYRLTDSLSAFAQTASSL